MSVIERDLQLIFAADLVPTESNEKYFISGDIEYLFGDDILDYISKVDFRCFNLEVTLTNIENRASYPGPHLMAKPETINAISKINPSLLTIGNNHALDQGPEGLLSTISVLKKANIPFTGAGKNLQEALAPHFFVSKGVKIGIFNCSEYEFVAASNNSCGVNPYDPLISFDLVKMMKQQCDVAIVLYHGGKEFYRYPSPQLQRVCRKFADYGADVVICQHTHCVGCEEKYNNSTIVYGQGNFLFDRNENEFKKTGVFVQVNINVLKNVKVEYIPFVKYFERVRLADTKQKEEIMNGFIERSEKILIPGFVEEAYDLLAEEYYEKYIKKMIGGNRLIRIINKLTHGKIYSKFYNDVQALAALNVISPENHNELFKAGLRNYAKKYRL